MARGEVSDLSEQESDALRVRGVLFCTKKAGEFGMVLSEDEVPDGEVLWRALKCSHPTSVPTSFAPYRHPFPLAVDLQP